MPGQSVSCHDGAARALSCGSSRAVSVGRGRARCGSAEVPPSCVLRTWSGGRRVRGAGDRSSPSSPPSANVRTGFAALSGPTAISSATANAASSSPSAGRASFVRRRGRWAPAAAGHTGRAAVASPISAAPPPPSPDRRRRCRRHPLRKRWRRLCDGARSVGKQAVSPVREVLRESVSSSARSR